jgi:hypothetical protein
MNKSSVSVHFDDEVLRFLDFSSTCFATIWRIINHPNTTWARWRNHQNFWLGQEILQFHGNSLWTTDWRCFEVQSELRHFFSDGANSSFLHQDPQLPDPWTEPLNCTGDGSQFWNFNGFQQRVVGSFDSLHINVFTNNLQPIEPYPVMVYVHGGGYSMWVLSVHKALWFHERDLLGALDQLNFTVLTF